MCLLGLLWDPNEITSIKSLTQCLVHAHAKWYCLSPWQPLTCLPLLYTPPDLAAMVLLGPAPRLSNLYIGLPCRKLQVFKSFLLQNGNFIWLFSSIFQPPC